MPAGLYHVSPCCNRADIATGGLDYTRGHSLYADAGLYRDVPPGNYLFTDIAAACAYRAIREQEELDEYGPDAEPYDLWQATSTNLKLLPDPLAHTHPLGAAAVYTPQPIPAAALILMEAGK